MENKLFWHKKFNQVSFDYEIYPTEDCPVSFFLLTQKEIEDLIKKSRKRQIYYNKNVKPKSWAGYDIENYEKRRLK
jgi:hypothetical protein